MNKNEISGYRWGSAELSNIHDDLIPEVLLELNRLQLTLVGKAIVFELGCGNGSVANLLTKHGWDVTGIDPSTEGIVRALESYPSFT
jgi:2-polyprenyl-6-hydroxyphenyl methylase/3-demethylubiquinone-9 3-methyltransferase